VGDLVLAPISLRQANEHVRRVHRHHPAARGMKFAVAVLDSLGELHAVAIASRPVSRVLDAEGYLEVTRVASDGTPNACSMLYGAMRRAGTGMGYPAHKIITYTLASEHGSSLRAAGWIEDGAAGGGSWSRAERPRTDAAPTEVKTRWLAGRRPVRTPHNSGTSRTATSGADALAELEDAGAPSTAWDNGSRTEHSPSRPSGCSTQSSEASTSPRSTGPIPATASSRSGRDNEGENDA
jgi:hypothetical protein